MFWLIPITGLLATVFWDSPLLLPAKLLTVLLHEMGHATVAMLFGAEVERISVTLQESGETIVTKLQTLPAFVAAVSAGYLSSALAGALVLNRGVAGGFGRVTLLFASLCLGYTSLLFTRGADTAFLIGMGWSLSFLVLAVFGRQVARAALVVLGTLILWYCFFDLFDFADAQSRTDADILSDFLVREGLIGQDARPLVSATIALSWAVLIVLLLFGLLRGQLLGKQRVPVAPGPPPEELPESFPGELSPEVELWLMQRGLGADGKPLIPGDGIHLPAEGPQRDPAHSGVAGQNTG